MPDYLSPDWEASALVLIDVQHDFVDGAAPIPGTADALPAMAELTRALESPRAGGTQRIGPEEFVVYKPRWSAFHRTGSTSCCASGA